MPIEKYVFEPTTRELVYPDFEEGITTLDECFLTTFGENMFDAMENAISEAMSIKEGVYLW
jgi:hypothetical protein